VALVTIYFAGVPKLLAAMKRRRCVHHRLMSRGLSVKQIVVVLYLVSLAGSTLFLLLVYSLVGE
jgi:UDP-N-acetylmuramyl pentapeptide phosphotransferase/UDP-N-acetylglucosamine-1-phosphate transferase